MFNAEYSPELNPIENVFGVWKGRTERDITTFDGLQDLLEKIAASFETLEQRVVSASFERCRNEVWTKVFHQGRPVIHLFCCFSFQTEHARISNLLLANWVWKTDETRWTPTKLNRAFSDVFQGWNPEWVGPKVI